MGSYHDSKLAVDDNGPRIGWYYPWGYAESSGTWPTTLTDSFTGSGSERLGFSVALSADGQTALVGAPNAGSGGAAYLYDNCAAFLYAEPASGWPAVPSPVATFTGTGSDYFGYSVAVSADGQVALVGKPFGFAAYLYDEPVSGWAGVPSPAATFTGTGDDFFGYSVALSPDGQADLMGGRDGELHGFASLHQLLTGGFDPALVVTLAGLGGTPVSATTAGAAHITALSTAADGALAISGHTWYVFAGGRAFGIPTPAELARLREADSAEPLVGEVTAAELSEEPASGALLSVHRLGVYASYQGELFRFKTMSQLFADGYGGTAAVPVPGTAALPVVYPYSGS